MVRKHHSVGNRTGPIRYRPQVIPYVIILGLGTIGWIVADYSVELERGSGITFSRVLVDFALFIIPILCFLIYGVARFVCLVLDRKSGTITYRNFFMIRTVPIAAIRRIEYGGTYVVAKSVYKSLFVVYEKPDGSESFVRIHQSSFLPRDLGDFIRNLLKVNPTIILNNAAEGLMKQAKSYEGSPRPERTHRPSRTGRHE